MGLGILGIDGGLRFCEGEVGLSTGSGEVVRVLIWAVVGVDGLGIEL